MSYLLHPCPFCGGKSLVVPPRRKQILCEGCGAEGPEINGDKSKTWETRPLEDALHAELATLKERAVEAERQRDKLAEKLADISDKMSSGVKPETVFCKACGICPEDEDVDIEGVTCWHALIKWAAQKDGE